MCRHSWRARKAYTNMNSQYSGNGERLVPGALIGYRAWRPIWGPAIRIAACAKPYVWVPKPERQRANCVRHPLFQPHVAPHVDCACGFYARLRDEDHGYAQTSICGVIEASGRVVLGTHGFRAEYATIKALYATSNSVFQMRFGPDVYGDPHWARGYHDALRAVSTEYQVPLFDSFEEAKKAFPPSDVSALMPAAGDGPESVPFDWNQHIDSNVPYTVVVENGRMYYQSGTCSNPVNSLDVGRATVSYIPRPRPMI